MTKKKLIALLAVLFISLFLSHNAYSLDTLDSYNVLWKSQSDNADGSMPVGGGDVGLNVWVEDNQLLFYIGKSGTFDGNNHMLKLGRVRIRLSPNPFGKDGRFRQELRLEKGYIHIQGESKDNTAKIKIWVEVFRPVAHVAIEADKPLSVQAQFECWRNMPRLLPRDCRKSRYPCMSLVGYPGMVVMRPDNVSFENNAVLWYHRNDNNDLLFDKEIRQQSLQQVKNQIWNPLKNRTFGGIIKAEGMSPDGISCGRYVHTNFKAWKLKSDSAKKKHHIKIYLHTDQTDTIRKWKQDLQRLVRKADISERTAWLKNRKWWRDFWNRSHLFINTQNPDRNETAWQIGKNYQLFRYMLACNAYGNWPTKFNGSFFTYDPEFVDCGRGVKTETPDFRIWGGGSFTAQNQRLVYWPMLKNGDFDMMTPQFDFYRRALKAAQLRTKVYWDHEGCSFTEQLENFGLPCGSIYGWLGSDCRWGKRQPDTPEGVQAFACVYQFGHQLDFSFMILEYYRYTGWDISKYLPFIDSSVTFFDEHYQYLQKKRSGKPLDENGHLVIYPSRACESYVNAKNPADVVAGLKAVLTRLIELPDRLVPDHRKERYKRMLERVPPLPVKEKNGNKYLAGAEEWDKYQVGEIPELYSVFPYGLFNLEKNNMDIARYTWENALRDRQKNIHAAWYQGGVFTARMGYTAEAKKIALHKLKNSPQRFPAFRESDDWAPDHNWPGVGMIGLQEMLMQTVGRKILLIPAWPKEWNVNFRLHAPHNTVVRGIYRDGEFEKLTVSPKSRHKDVQIMK